MHFSSWRNPFSVVTAVMGPGQKKHKTKNKLDRHPYITIIPVHGVGYPITLAHCMGDMLHIL